MTPRSVQLNEAHQVGGFGCGVDDLSHWLHNHAWAAQRSGTANTFVWSRGGDVVAYYTLSAHQVIREMLPDDAVRGMPEVISSYIIGKLALDRSVQGEGRGAVLFWDAFSRCVDAARSGAAAKLIVVDAIDGARSFYALHMNGIPDDPNRFFIKVSTAERALR